MNITSRKKISIAVLVVLIAVLVTTGCFGDDEKPKPKVTYEELSGDRNMEAWADFDSQGDGGDTTVEETITMNLNSSLLNYVKVTITFQDSDEAHADSDEDSDPDMFRVKINSTGYESNIASGQTPGTATLEIPPKNATMSATGEEEQIQFGPELSIFIEADCQGGKPYKPFLPNRPGGSPLVYVDQGIYFSITVEYTYLEMT